MCGELKKLVRQTAEEALIALFEEEASDLIGTDRHDRTAERKAYRFGHYKRGITTTSGKVPLKIPKLKGTRFATAIIEGYKRGETNMEEAIIEIYLASVTTRRIESSRYVPCGLDAH